VLALLAVILALSDKWKFPRYQAKFSLLMSLGFFVVGFLLATNQKLALKEELALPAKADYYFASVLTFPEQKANSDALELSVFSSRSGGKVSDFQAVRIICYAADSLGLDTLLPGDQMVFSSHPVPHQEPINPGQFDYGAYLEGKGIAGTVYLASDVNVYRPHSKPFSFKRLFEKAQNSAFRVFSESGMDKRELGVASALILGKRSEVLRNTRDAFADAGVVHILAVSGLHVGIIYLVLIGIFNKLLPDKKWRIAKLIAVLLLLWSYAGITGFSSSVLRAATMFSFIALGKQAGRHASVYNMLAASAIVLLIYDPSMLKKVGFQLSYMAVAGIVFFFPRIYKLVVFKTWFFDKAWALLVVSFSAQLATFPLSIYYFNQFPNLFWATNLLVIPLATLALYSGLAYLAVFWMPIVNRVVAFLLDASLYVLNEFVQWISQVPLSVTDGLQLSVLGVMLFYLLILTVVPAFNDPRKRYIFVPLGCILILVSLYSYKEISHATRSELSVLEGADQSLICFQMGSEAYIFSRDTIGSEGEKHNFYIEGFCTEKGIETLNWRSANSTFQSDKLLCRDGFIACSDKIVFRIDGDYRGTANYQNADIVLLTGFVEIDRLAFPNHKQLIILDTGLPFYLRKEIRAHFDKGRVKYWDMREDGAFSVALSHS
jgi:competence protein ComEC